MARRAFLDTNVLVYLFDRDEPEKRRIATELLRSWDGQLVVSTQVLQEFYVTTTRKLARPLSESAAEDACRRFASLPVVPSDSGLVLRSIERARRDGLSLWDALIVSAARESGCDVLLSEDLQHSRVFEQVEVLNPFRARFESGSLDEDS